MTPLVRTALAACLTLPLLGCGEPEPADPLGDPARGPDVVPGSDAAPGTAVPGVPPVAAPDANDGGPTPAGTDTPTSPPLAPSPEPPASPAEPPPAPPSEPPSDPPRTTDGPSIDGTAESVDCAAALPCRLEAVDGAFAITLSAADGEALDGGGPLRVDFAVEALSRDMPVGIDRRSFALAGGQVLDTESLRLGSAAVDGARDEAVFTLVAGVPINGHLLFAGTLLGAPDSLDRLTLVLAEAGATRELRFADVPLGPEPSSAVDCRGTLPCDWRSADGGAVLTLAAVAPLYWNRSTRLVVDWSLVATRPLEALTYVGGLVTDGAGSALEVYGVELAGESSRDDTPLVRPLAAGEPLNGRLVLRRVPPADTLALARVEPGIVERRAPRSPRWRPVFLDVPIRPESEESDP